MSKNTPVFFEVLETTLPTVLQVLKNKGIAVHLVLDQADADELAEGLEDLRCDDNLNPKKRHHAHHAWEALTDARIDAENGVLPEIVIP